WTPLSTLRFNKSRIDERLYLLDECAYVFTVPYDRDLTPGRGEEFVTIVLWASTDGAAKRVMNFNIEADADQTPSIPPSEMIPVPDARSYAEILAGLNSGDYGKYTETSSFRIASDGKRIYNAIEIKCWTVCFRAIEKDGSTSPFAVMYGLS